MKRFGKLLLAGISMALLLWSNEVQAFDPVEPPPKKTLAWTVGIVRPSVQFQDATLEEACEFLMGTGSIPPSYSIKIDSSRIKVPKDWKISVDEKNISVIKVMAMIAEKCDADLLVKPGVMVLVPRG